MSAQRRHASTSVRGAVRALASSMARGRPYLSFGRSCNPNFVASPSLRRRLDFRSDSGPHRDHRTRCVNAPAMQTRVVYKRPAAKTPECRACVRDSVDAAKHFERVWTLPARCLHRLFRGLNAEGIKRRTGALQSRCRGLPTHAHRQETQPGVPATQRTSSV
jgi:hypothetical protein